NNFGIAAIVDQNGNLEGAITDGALRRAIIKHEAKVFALAAKDIMTSKPRTIPHHVFAVDAVRSMEDSIITALFVVEDASSRLLVARVRMDDLGAAKII